MHWLDEGRISALFTKLGIDETYGGELQAVLTRCDPHPVSDHGLDRDALARSSDAAAFPVFAIGSDRRVIAWNRSMEALTGIPAAGMIGRGDYAYAVPFYGAPRPMLADHVLSSCSTGKIPLPVSVTRDGETYASAPELVEVNGRSLRMQCRAACICGESGRVIAAIQSVGIHPAEEQAPAGTPDRIPEDGSVVLPVRSPARTAGPVPDPAWQVFNSAAGTVPDPSPDEELLRRKRVDVHTAFDQLTATEERLLKNYEELVRTRAQLIESEQKVRAQELFLKCVISDAREGIVAFDRELRYTLWNRFMETLTGIPAEKVLGRQASEIFPVLKVAGADLLLERAYAGDTVESSDISFLAPMSGKQVWVRVIYSPLYDAAHAISGVIGIIQDTTARKVMEYALQTTIVQLMESESKYRNVFNARNLPVLIVNAGSQAIIDLNEAAVQLYGWSREEMLGMTITDLQADAEEAGDTVAAGIPYVRTRNQRKNDGTIFPADVSADYFILRGISVTIFSIRDLSPVQQVSESLRIANTKLNLIIGITRHDVLNNLTAVWGYNEMLQSDVTESRSIEMLRKQEKAIVTIRNQLEFTREYDDLGMREPQWQNVCTVASRAFAQFVHGISFSCTTADLEIFTDPLLDRVLYNLFDNSLRYGGDRLSGIRISCRQVAGGLDLWFEDDGIGIVPVDKERIFLRGFGKHTGMGLFLTREILTITRIGIRETGIYGKGARFEFHVPHGGFRFAGTSSPPWLASVEEETSAAVFFRRLMRKPGRGADAD
jgi:PAS domain S-box-containing protein